MNSAKLARYSMTAVLGLLEALCSPTYLYSAKDHVAFDFVFENTQQKKPLRIRACIIPTMTRFLFDSDSYRNRFARAAWESLPSQSLSQDTWDWAVHDSLAEAILDASYASGVPTADKIKLFWEGFLLILNSLSEERVIHSLRAMAVQPSVYFMALDHTKTDSVEALGLVMKGLRALMEKSPTAFWAAYDPMHPEQLYRSISGSPAFPSLLRQSLAPESMLREDGLDIPAFAAWAAAFIRSLPLGRRIELCEALLGHLFDFWAGVGPTRSKDGQVTCTLAGLKVLLTILEGFLDPGVKMDSGTSLIYINTILNVVVKHRDVIIHSAELLPGDRHNVGLSGAAISVIHSALALDSKAIRVEWNAIHESGRAQQALERQSDQLWISFTEMLWPGRIELARAMLMAIMPLRSIEQFKPDRNRTLEEGGPKKKFNERFQKTAAAVGTMLRRLSDFDPADLHMFCYDHSSPTIQPIVASVIHGEDVIREAGTDLIKAITGEPARPDAVNKMLEDHFSPFLDAFSSAVTAMTVDNDSNKPWAPMRPILQLSADIMHGLCDPSVGRLRSETVTPTDLGAVERWWDVEWQCIGYMFRTIRFWNERIDNKTLEDFFRTTMELADSFLAQDGLIASVLIPLSGNKLAAGDEDPAAQAMKDVLEPPRTSSTAIVDMLKLRDQYLISLTANVLVKLLRRLREQNLALPPRTATMIQNTCKNRREEGGDYVTKTNLSDTQRVEILKTLGEDVEEDQQEFEVTLLSSSTTSPYFSAGNTSKANRQSRLDFSKASEAASARSPLAPRTNREDALGLQGYVDKHRPTLNRITARQALPKRDPKVLVATQASIKEARMKERAEKAKRDAEAIARARALRVPSRTVVGEGSGLQGIAGARGKDHSRGGGAAVPAQKDQIMVGSSSEDEDEDESDDDEALTSRNKAGLKMLDEATRRQRGVMLAEKRPVKKTKLQRSAKDMRARLIPPMDILHQAILEWDIFHEGNDPGNGVQCSRVANVYLTPLDYKQAFLPLLVSEAWRSFVTAKDECTSKPFGIKVVNRMSVDRFLEVTTSMPMTPNKDRGGLGEGDIVLISQSADPLADADYPHCLARIWKTSFKKGSLEVVYRLSSKMNQLLSFLLPGAEFHAVRITNMITIEREYAALESLQYYDLMDEVLKAEPSPLLNWDTRAVEGMMHNYRLNPGQAKAILSAKENDGFTLIQGPPGTGKTKTIIALVGALLSGALRLPSGATSLSRPGSAQHPGLASSGQKAAATSKKLLVCAPSNAAVDELVLRLKAGVKTTSGSFHKIEVLRLGRSDAINAAVRDVTLDELVKTRMDAEMNKNGNANERERMHQEAGEIKQKLADLRPHLEAAREEGTNNPPPLGICTGTDRYLRLATGPANTNRIPYLQLQREFDELKRRQAHIGARIDAAKDGGNTYAREVEIKRRQVQQEILDRSQVLCATLSGSGHEMFKNLNVEFETVIIDEAAQCVELSALIPLKYGCCKCILVGDPKQLPPTVLSQSAARFGYDQSLFVRMQQNYPDHVHLLDMQYRMHPLISSFPSQEFYEGRLEDAADMAALRFQPWHRSDLLGPYRFFDVRGTQEKGHRGRSLVNTAELKAATQLYHLFRTKYSDIDPKGKIGIITPYKAQLQALRQRFTEIYGEVITDVVEFNTTDAFQGRECEIIIFSCVRASPTGGIGFMNDIRRMNVGLTRAKSSLWILGDSQALVQGEFWEKLIYDAKQRDLFTSGAILSRPETPGIETTMTLTSPYSSSPSIVPPPAPKAQRLPAPAPSSTPPAPPAHPASPVPHVSPPKELKRSNSDVDMSDAPTGPAAKRVSRALKQETDPAAMQVLGLSPPPRPLAPRNNHSKNDNNNDQPRPPPSGPNVFPRKPIADPFIRRKKPHRR